MLRTTVYGLVIGGFFVLAQKPNKVSLKDAAEFAFYTSLMALPIKSIVNDLTSHIINPT